MSGSTNADEPGTDDRLLGDRVRLRQPRDGLLDLLLKGRAQDKVLGRIAVDHQFGCHHQVGPLPGRRGTRGQHLVGIGRDRAHGRVDLGQGNGKSVGHVGSATGSATLERPSRACRHGIESGPEGGH